MLFLVFYSNFDFLPNTQQILSIKPSPNAQIAFLSRNVHSTMVLNKTKKLHKDHTHTLSLPLQFIVFDLLWDTLHPVIQF